jgi:hypothetical protein
VTERKMRKFIAEIPDNGWCDGVSQATFQQLATQLREYGVPADTVADVLNDAYWAAEAEFETRADVFVKEKT